jgi:dihydrolipoamide dehydrogenase
LTLYEALHLVQCLAQSKKPRWRYQGIPWSLVGPIPLARVGWTEAQARRRYPLSGDRITTSIGLGKDTAHYWMTSTPIAWGKLVWCDRRLIGATLIAPQGEEMIHTLALAIRQGMTREQLKEVGAIGGSSYELLQRIT